MASLPGAADTSGHQEIINLGYEPEVE